MPDDSKLEMQRDEYRDLLKEIVEDSGLASHRSLHDTDGLAMAGGYLLVRVDLLERAMRLVDDA